MNVKKILLYGLAATTLFAISATVSLYLLPGRPAATKIGEPAAAKSGERTPWHHGSNYQPRLPGQLLFRSAHCSF